MCVTLKTAFNYSYFVFPEKDPIFAQEMHWKNT
jgi:hypothetical protein